MKIRKTTEQDFDRLMEIYAYARDYMAKTGNPNQCGHLRIDTHTDNKVMQKLLTSLGFTKCGIIHVIEDNYPRFAYEKIK